MFSLGLCQCCLYPPPSGLQVVAARGLHERGQRPHQERHRHWGNSDPGLYERWPWHKARVGIRRAALGSAQLLLTWPHRSLSMAAQAFLHRSLSMAAAQWALWGKSTQRLHPRLFHLCICIAASCLPDCRALHLHLCICTLYLSSLHVLHCICLSASLHLSSRCLALHLHSTFLISLSCTASVISASASLRLFILPARVSCTLSYMGSPWHSIQCMCCLVSLGLVLHPGHAPDIMHCNVRQGAS